VALPWLTPIARFAARRRSLVAFTRVAIHAKCGVDALCTNRLNWIQINVLFELFRVLLHIKIAQSLLPCCHKNNKAVVTKTTTKLFSPKARPSSFSSRPGLSLSTSPRLPVVFFFVVTKRSQEVHDHALRE
jgi:hypothetical protein